MGNQPGKYSGKRSPEENRTRRKFGQNFLIDQAIIGQISDDIPVEKNDWVIEIGPGKGAITKEIAKKCTKILAIEVDPKWAGYLRVKSGISNLEVLEEDASKVDLPKILSKKQPPVVLGNLPYNRAAPILFHFLTQIKNTRFFYFMVQYEVAKRICAQPGTRDFGQMTVMIQNFCKAELRLKILPDAFRPRPKVWSATVLLTPLDSPECEDPLFGFFVSTAFSQKRKQLTNTLGLLYPRNEVGLAMKDLGMNEKSRAEQLSVEDFHNLFKKLGAPSNPAKG